MTTYTTRQTADLLGLTPGRVRQISRALKVGRTRLNQRGVVLAFSDADIEAMRNRNTLVGKPGQRGFAQKALEQELAYFQAVKGDLLKHNKGQFALIKGSELLGTFTTAPEAFEAGVKALGNQPFLIKQVVEDEETISYPALSVGMLYARP